MHSTIVFIAVKFFGLTIQIFNSFFCDYAQLYILDYNKAFETANHILCLLVSAVADDLWLAFYLYVRMHVSSTYYLILIFILFGTLRGRQKNN